MIRSPQKGGWQAWVPECSREVLYQASHVHGVERVGGEQAVLYQSTPSTTPSLQCAQVCLLIGSSVMQWTLLLLFLHLPIDSVPEREISIFHLLGFPQIPTEKQIKVAGRSMRDAIQPHRDLFVGSTVHQSLSCVGGLKLQFSRPEGPQTGMVTKWCPTVLPCDFLTHFYR